MHENDGFHVTVEGLNTHICEKYPTFAQSGHNNRMHKFANFGSVLPEVVTLTTLVG